MFDWYKTHITGALNYTKIFWCFHITFCVNLEKIKHLKKVKKKEFSFGVREHRLTLLPYLSTGQAIILSTIFCTSSRIFVIIGMILLEDNRIYLLSTFLNFVVANMVKCDAVYISRK